MAIGGSLRAQYARRRRRTPGEDLISILETEEKPEEEKQEGKKDRDAPSGSSKGSGGGVPFAVVLREKYEPLAGGEEAPARAGERKGKKRRRKLKKYGKNVGKALQKGCRYLVLGIQSLANAYSSPLGVAVSIATAMR